MKLDFWSVKEALEDALGKQISTWVFIPYYVIGALITIPLAPFIWVYFKIRLHYIMKEFKN